MLGRILGFPRSRSVEYASWRSSYASRRRVRWTGLEKGLASLRRHIGHRALARSRRPDIDVQAILEAVSQRNLIFTVTSGRTGTTYLSQLLQLCPDTTVLHEAAPAFEHTLDRIGLDSRIGREFWLHHKLPAILDRPERHYVETSNVFGKGFLEPLVALGVRPRLILLGRPLREIAWSYLERNTVPARTDLGIRYMLRPESPGVLPLRGWRRMSDYQLCFWMALEMERRQFRYFDLMKQCGGTAVPLTVKALRDFANFEILLQRLGLPTEQLAPGALSDQHAAIGSTGRNVNRERLTLRIDFDREEDEVWRLAAQFEPLLQSLVRERYEGQASPSFDVPMLHAALTEPPTESAEQ